MAYTLTYYHGLGAGWLGDTCVVSLEDKGLRVLHPEADGESLAWRVDIPYTALRAVTVHPSEDRPDEWERRDGEPARGMLRCVVHMAEGADPTTVLMSGPLSALQALALDLVLAEVGLEPVEGLHAR